MNEYRDMHTYTDTNASDVSRAETHTSLSPKKESFLSETIRFILIAVVIVIPIRIFVAQPFIVSGLSMHPTFTSGDYLIVDELSYRFVEPQRGDVVVFRLPTNRSRFLIKRIIGLPGETVVLSGSGVSIAHADTDNPVPLNEPYVTISTRENSTTVLADDEYFVLGDNRQASSDSRVWGPLPGELIVGRALLRLLPASSLSLFPGAVNLKNPSEQ